MSENSEPRPPVIVDFNLNWPGYDGHESGSVEVDRDEWDAKTPAERLALCEQIADEEAHEKFSWGWHIADPVDYAATEE